MLNRRCTYAFTTAQMLLLLLVRCAPLQSQDTKPVVLDSVVAVVNNQAVLSSDIDEEIRLSVIDSAVDDHSELTRVRALDQLISRALIQQQIGKDEQSLQPANAEVATRIAEIRKQAPACLHQACETESGWKAFLADHQLTEDRVDDYLRTRVVMLRFIEQRFSQGINITNREIENYYRNRLVPQYKADEQAPPLEEVSARISEILLQQHVTSLFDDWLNSLRKQGDVEVLDPALQTELQRTPPEPQIAAQTPAVKKGGR